MMNSPAIQAIFMIFQIFQSTREKLKQMANATLFCVLVNLDNIIGSK